MGKYLLGKDLKAMRVTSDFTTSMMAEFMGVKSRKTIENWEAENSEPSINQFLKYCHVCKEEPEKLIDYAINKRGQIKARVAKKK